MKHSICQHYILKTNKVQNAYIRHYLYRLDAVCQHMYQYCTMYTKAYTKHEIYCILKEQHKYDLQGMEKDEIYSLIYEIYKRLKSDSPSYKKPCVCVITSSELIWHFLPLRSLFQEKYRLHTYYQFAFAKLYIKRKRVHLDIYYKKIENSKVFFEKRKI